ncbi:MAG: DUF1295 domain-containing protein, partial [Gemmatimonadetes bacterium]|nr:DUF1295 domain-containing protein [Gemmatimonadota bacterium]
MPLGTSVLWDVAFVGLGVVVVAFTVLWAASVKLEDASIVDPFWGPGFLIAALTYLVVDGGYPVRGRVVVALVAIWAVRLGYHLLVRNRKEGEDKRYQQMREGRGDAFWWQSLYSIFWLQAGLLWVISAPLFGSIVSGAPLGPWDVAAALLFAVGLSFEAVADSQLARFKAHPANKGKVLDTGLWRYSRHPNYFGEAVLWWGFYLFAVGAEQYWTVVGPVLISFLLLKVSGVTMLEDNLKSSRPGYEEYVRRTSAF